MTTLKENRTIGEIVAEDYRTAQIFKDRDIDFCCKGHRSLQEVCDTQQIDMGELIDEIRNLQKTAVAATDFQSWPVDLLADYIQKRHHRYVEEKIPVLKEYLEKLCRVQGKRQPELHEIT